MKQALKAMWPYLKAGGLALIALLEVVAAIILIFTGEP